MVEPDVLSSDVLSSDENFSGYLIFLLDQEF